MKKSEETPHESYYRVSLVAILMLATICCFVPAALWGFGIVSVLLFAMSVVVTGVLALIMLFVTLAAVGVMQEGDAWDHPSGDTEAEYKAKGKAVSLKVLITGLLLSLVMLGAGLLVHSLPEKIATGITLVIVMCLALSSKRLAKLSQS